MSIENSGYCVWSNAKIVMLPTIAKPVGAYWIGGIAVGLGFHLNKRPFWLHRIAMRLVFGWQWRDAF